MPTELHLENGFLLLIVPVLALLLLQLIELGSLLPLLVVFLLLVVVALDRHTATICLMRLGFSL